MKKNLLLLFGVLALCGSSMSLYGQQNSYSQTNLVGNAAGVANNTDPQLSNPWGIAFVPGSTFWISDNNSGFSTLYDAQGNKQQLTVTIPGAGTNPCNPGCPTGVVANTTGKYGGGSFLFDTEDGIIASWTGGNSAVTVVDNSASGAVYKGLAQLNNGSGSFLLAANFRSGKIDVFDSNLKPASLTGAFKDPNLETGFAPHGVHVINNSVYVAYALQDSAKHDPIVGSGNGAVDMYDMNGNFVKRLVTGGALNAPWGVVLAPATFGAFANDILVGNFGDGSINVYDPNSGKSLGRLTDSNNHAIVNPGMWDMVFGKGGTGDPNTLYITAGGSNQTTGLFAAITTTQKAATADFSLSVSPQTVSVSPGGSTSLTVSASATGGFNSAIALKCSTPTGVSCSLSPTTITPGTSASSSTLQLTVAPSSPPSTYHAGVTPVMLLPLSMGILGLGLTARKLGRSTLAKRLPPIGLAVLGVALLSAAGCGSGAMSTPTPSSSNVGGGSGVSVTGTSGTLTHTVPITLTVQ
jgi:uncharacterized protein (TIGR03118 family)